MRNYRKLSWKSTTYKRCPLEINGLRIKPYKSMTCDYALDVVGSAVAWLAIVSERRRVPTAAFGLPAKALATVGVPPKASETLRRFAKRNRFSFRLLNCIAGENKKNSQFYLYLPKFGYNCLYLPIIFSPKSNTIAGSFWVLPSFCAKPGGREGQLAHARGRARLRAQLGRKEGFCDPFIPLIPKFFKDQSRRI